MSGVNSFIRSATIILAGWVIVGEQQTNWRRILVRLREAATCPKSLYGQVAETSMPDEQCPLADYF
ncbi:MAG: hypothetical protein N838_23700 [Thiohalocapsa sp. PB-PSB1]|jgi:hypothetical protein|nr:MAG: hypothetical protein N838_23700 [Thiohalocapsa sp. PB-PSB1]